MTRDVVFSVRFTHRLRFTREAFDRRNNTLADVMPATEPSHARVLVFVDKGAADPCPRLAERIEAFLTEQAHVTLAGPVRVIPGREEIKNGREQFELMLRQIHDAHLCRQSYVLAVGGGALLDTVGFAAAITHRGIRLIRMPTTTLSQADSGVGVKNGINVFEKKNYLGTFTPPWAVVNDERFLHTLSDRDWRCGFAEAVKVGLIKDAALFEQIAAGTARLRARDMGAAVPIIQRSAELHLQHITSGGDPFELTVARPLDFGHWAAHKLEQLTHFRLRHGEAVAIGVALDVSYAAQLGLLDPIEAVRIRACLAGLGFRLFDEALFDEPALLDGLEEFREHLGGPLTIPMIRRVGEMIEVHEIDRGALRGAVETLAAEAAPRVVHSGDEPPRDHAGQAPRSVPTAAANAGAVGAGGDPPDPAG